MHLVTSFTTKVSPKRLEEIQGCLQQNLANPLISSVHICTEDDVDVPGAIIHRTVAIPSFRDLVNVCNSLGDEQICIIANADIVFDNTLSLVKFDDPSLVYCLTRWHPEVGMGEPKPRDDDMAFSSFDSWILKTPIYKIKNIGFHLGVLGCDTAFTYALWESGRKPINPSKIIRTLHVHGSGERLWNLSTKVRGDHMGVLISDSLEFEKNHLEFGFSEEGSEDVWIWHWEWIQTIDDVEYWGREDIPQIVRDYYRVPFWSDTPREYPQDIEALKDEFRKRST